MFWVVSYSLVFFAISSFFKVISQDTKRYKTRGYSKVMDFSWTYFHISTSRIRTRISNKDVQQLLRPVRQIGVFYSINNGDQLTLICNQQHIHLLGLTVADSRRFLRGLVSMFLKVKKAPEGAVLKVNKVALDKFSIT